MSFITYLWNLDQIDINKLEESKVSQTIKQYQEQIYKKLIQDLDFSFKHKEYKKILIQVPFDHIRWFLEILKQEKQNSILRNSDVEIVQINHFKIANEDNISQTYEKYFDYITNFDRFIEIFSTWKEMETFAKNENHRKEVSQAFADFMKKLLSWIVENPKLKTYFPSQEQADLENMSLEDFYKLYMKASSLDWEKAQLANEELVKLFREYDYIKIVWENANISFSIKWMWARNSVIRWNYPGCEVFSAPVKNGVDGWIYYPNETYFKFSWDTAKWLYFEFKNWKLIDFDIKDDIINKEEIKQRFLEKFDEQEWNRYLWELAFGTNPYVPVGVKHKLIGEKAFGMHFALWRCYKYPEVNNGNEKASIHWDAIRTLKDDVKVYFWKENWEEILVIDNWIYNKEICPRLYKFSLI